MPFLSPHLRNSPFASSKSVQQRSYSCCVYPSGADLGTSDIRSVLVFSLLTATSLSCVSLNKTTAFDTLMMMITMGTPGVCFLASDIYASTLIFFGSHSKLDFLHGTLPGRRILFDLVRVTLCPGENFAGSWIKVRDKCNSLQNPALWELVLLPAGTFSRRDPTQMGAVLHGIYACHLLVHTKCMM